MSTTIKSGSEYAHLLEASGMAYELSPLSIAEKAFEEGADSLRAELARVKAERDGYRSDIERFVWNLAAVSQRNAELVAALRDAKSDFVSISEYWNGGNGSALDAAARNSEYADEAALKVTAALAATPGLRTDNPMAEPVMGGLPRYDGEKLGTPANQQPKEPS